MNQFISMIPTLMRLSIPNLMRLKIYLIIRIKISFINFFEVNILISELTDSTIKVFRLTDLIIIAFKMVV